MSPGTMNSQHREKAPPVYTGDPDYYAQRATPDHRDRNREPAIRERYVEVPLEVARAVPWYRKRPCLIFSIIIGICAIAAGVTAVVLLTRPSHDHSDDKVEKQEKETSSTLAEPSISIITVTETATEEEPSTTVAPPSTSSSSTSIKPSVVTVTWSAPEESDEPVEPVTLTRTITKSEEDDDIDKIVSSILSNLPVPTTDVVTVTNTVEPSSTPVASSSSSTSDSDSSSSTLGSAASEDSTSTTEATSSSIGLPFVRPGGGASSASEDDGTSTEPSRTSSASPTSSSPPPSLSTNSNVVAVDVNIGPSNLHRRLLIWQDNDGALVARDSAQGDTNVYKINSQLDDNQAPDPKPGTPLAGAPNNEGGIHVFYLSSSKNQVVNLLQQEAGSWTYEGTGPEVHERSSLAATWHQSESDTSAVVLACISTTGDVELHLSDGKSSSDWETMRPDGLQGMEMADTANVGLTLTSGVQNPDDESGVPGPGEYSGLFLLLEGEETVQVAECVVEKQNVTECFFEEDLFADYEDGPTPISSHPTFLSWSLQRENDGSPPIVYGFLAAEKQASKVWDYRFEPSIPEASPTGSVTEFHSDMTRHSVVNREVHAMAMTDERVLFVRSGGKLLELTMENEEWEVAREIDTAVSL